MRYITGGVANANSVCNEITLATHDAIDRDDSYIILASSLRSTQTPEGLAAFHAAIFHRRLLLLEHPGPDGKAYQDD